ncbi:MAG: radical SAM protein [Candidatus Omnitrophota bacterium]
MRSNLIYKRIKSISKTQSLGSKVYNLRCRPYSNFFSNFILVHNCDTRFAVVNKRYCNVETIKEKGFKKTNNPLSCKKLLKIIERLNKRKGPYHSVSFTGGEPLLQKDFLKEILPSLRQKGMKIYLETNGILSEELRQVIDYIDFIAMDFKLPSSTGTEDFWDEHKRFLKIASKRKVFVKAVICNSTKLKDIKKAGSLLAACNKDIPFVLQPNFFELSKQLIIKIRDFQRFCLKHLSDVRIIPQMHRLVGLR